MKATQKLHDAGQSIWLDNITRALLNTGGLKRYIDELSVTGLTSNPSIFDLAIKSSHDYDAEIREKSAGHKEGEALFFELALEDLTRAEALLDRGIDIAIGSRAIEHTKILEHQSFLRERVAKVFGLIQRNYLGLKLKDTQCGFKLFTRESAHKIFSEVKLNSVIFDGEVLWLAEFPVEWTHDPDTRLTYNFIRSLKVLRDMLSIPLLHFSQKQVAIQPNNRTARVSV